jgi:adenosylcobyric acid synthase
MTAKTIMVLGTTSGAGKSWLTTALCRYYARQGLKVAPFKAQNMSNNARVVAGRQFPDEPPLGKLAPSGGSAAHAVANVGVHSYGGEIGSAQYFQALAANAVPEVRMNPLLLKPESDTSSQVVLLGQVNDTLTQTPWRERSELVWPMIQQSLHELMAENDVVVIEGAGSPAEINLASSDIVNMRVALAANASCLLITDIDRGGAFAHLYGTYALLPAQEQALIKGFVLNKFRGDAALLVPGPAMLQHLTGVPIVATLPMWWQHGLPEEDGLFDDRNINRGSIKSGSVTLTIAIIAYPRISNLDEFQALKNVPGVRLKWVRSPGDLLDADWVILPGSKNTSGDLAWLRKQGLDAAIARHATQGKSVLGICGGLQMLGEALIDVHSIDLKFDNNAPGLGLLPLVTHFEVRKTVQHRQTQFGAVAGAWSALSQVTVSGYEIHHGQTAQHQGLALAGDLACAVLPEQLGWQNQAGNVFGVYLHGMFEDPTVLQALFGATVPTLDSVFDGLADYVAQHFEAGFLDSLIA